MSTTLRPRPRSSGEAAGPPELEGPLPDRIARLPILILYPHSRCNCRCLMCDIWRASARDELDPAAVAAEAVRWRAMGVERVVLSGGEPLMHADLWALAAPLVEAGMEITLLSTGLLLERHADRIGRWVDDVVVSLDGPPDVHDAIRNLPGAYDRLDAGVAAVRRAAPGVAVTARCTVQGGNFARLRGTVRAAKELRLDQISFLAVDVSSEAFNRPGGWPDERRQAIAIAAADLPGLRAELDALYAHNADDFASSLVAESPDKLDRRLYAYFAAIAGRGRFPTVRCNAPWVSAVVEADGTVRPCFFHPPVGRWTGGSLDDVLNSERAVRFRRRLDVASDPTCRRCVCSLNLKAGNGAP